MCPLFSLRIQIGNSPKKNFYFDVIQIMIIIIYGDQIDTLRMEFMCKRIKVICKKMKLICRRIVGV